MWAYSRSNLFLRPPAFKDHLCKETALSRSQKCNSYCNSPVFRDYLSYETTCLMIPQFSGPLSGLLTLKMLVATIDALGNFETG